jgi:hypothetical protein
MENSAPIRRRYLMPILAGRPTNVPKLSTPASFRTG